MAALSKENRAMLRVLIAAGIFAGTFAPSASAPFELKSVTVNLPDSDRKFPSGTGSDAANNNCLACHSSDMVLNQPALPKAAWEAEVKKMMNA
jgi:mono/diheme cytochrome c family protein